MSIETGFAENSQAVDERANQPEKPTLLCRVVFMALGLLLLAAAGFKTYQVYSQPMQTLVMAGTVNLICIECCFGTWLLIGIRSAWTLWAAVVCFAAFASVSAAKYLSGASSCGCFGLLQVNPAITLVLDVVAINLLILCRTGVETPSESTLRRVFPRVASLAMVLSLLSTSVSLFGQLRFAKSDGSITKPGGLVVLDPKSWVGRRWPLLDETGVPAELATGTWDVLMFRHDCDICHGVMLEIEQAFSTSGVNDRVALIGIDKLRDDAPVTRLHNLGCLLGHLPQDREWFATTPLRLRLNDAVCVSASVVEHWE